MLGAHRPHLDHLRLIDCNERMLLMQLKLGMLGMWHTHADGIVRQVAEHPDEFSLVGFYDPDPAVVAAQSGKWVPRIKDFRVYDKPEELLRQPLDGGVVEGRVFENLSL